MFRYTLLRGPEIIVVSHYGDYVGAEADKAMLSILGSRTLAERHQLKFVIQDFSAVEKMSLHDTDFSRRTRYFDKLKKLFEKQDLASIFNNISVYQVRPDRIDIFDTLVLREKKLRQYHEYQIDLIQRNSLAEALLALGENKVPSEKDWISPSETQND